jgi:hypothetical protein
MQPSEKPYMRTFLGLPSGIAPKADGWLFGGAQTVDKNMSGNVQQMIFASGFSISLEGSRMLEGTQTKFDFDRETT